MAGEFGPSFRPGEEISKPEAMFEQKIAKAREYLLRVMKTWIEAVPSNLRESYFNSEAAMKAKTEIAEYIRDLAAGAVTSDSDEVVMEHINVIGDRLYGLWRIEENKGHYISGQLGDWRQAGLKGVMQNVMRLVGYGDERINHILPSRDVTSDKPPVEAEVVDEGGEKVIDGRDEFYKLAQDAIGHADKAPTAPENPETKASGE